MNDVKEQAFMSKTNFWDASYKDRDVLVSQVPVLTDYFNLTRSLNDLVKLTTLPIRGTNYTPMSKMQLSYGTGVTLVKADNKVDQNAISIRIPAQYTSIDASLEYQYKLKQEQIEIDAGKSKLKLNTGLYRKNIYLHAGFISSEMNLLIQSLMNFTKTFDKELYLSKNDAYLAYYSKGVNNLVGVITDIFEYQNSSYYNLSLYIPKKILDTLQNNYLFDIKKAFTSYPKFTKALMQGDYRNFERKQLVAKSTDIFTLYEQATKNKQALPYWAINFDELEQILIERANFISREISACDNQEKFFNLFDSLLNIHEDIETIEIN